MRHLDDRKLPCILGFFPHITPSRVSNLSCLSTGFNLLLPFLTRPILEIPPRNYLVASL